MHCVISYPVSQLTNGRSGLAFGLRLSRLLSRAVGSRPK